GYDGLGTNATSPGASTVHIRCENPSFAPIVVHTSVSGSSCTSNLRRYRSVIASRSFGRPRVAEYRWLRGLRAASASLSTAMPGDGTSGLPNPRSMTSSPARRASIFSESMMPKTYGGRALIRRNSMTGQGSPGVRSPRFFFRSTDSLRPHGAPAARDELDVDGHPRCTRRRTTRARAARAATEVWDVSGIPSRSHPKPAVNDVALLRELVRLRRAGDEVRLQRPQPARRGRGGDEDRRLTGRHALRGRRVRLRAGQAEGVDRSQLVERLLDPRPAEVTERDRLLEELRNSERLRVPEREVDVRTLLGVEALDVVEHLRHAGHGRVAPLRPLRGEPVVLARVRARRTLREERDPRRRLTEPLQVHVLRRGLAHQRDRRGRERHEPDGVAPRLHLLQLRGQVGRRRAERRDLAELEVEVLGGVLDAGLAGVSVLVVRADQAQRLALAALVDPVRDAVDRLDLVRRGDRQQVRVAHPLGVERRRCR